MVTSSGVDVRGARRRLLRAPSCEIIGRLDKCRILRRNKTSSRHAGKLVLASRVRRQRSMTAAIEMFRLFDGVETTLRAAFIPRFRHACLA